MYHELTSKDFRNWNYKGSIEILLIMDRLYYFKFNILTNMITKWLFQ